MTATYANKKAVVDTLLEVGRRSAMESNADHPEDIAYAITFAVESAAVTVQVMHERGFLK